MKFKTVMNIQKIKDKLRESIDAPRYHGDVVGILKAGHSIVVHDSGCYVLYHWNGVCWIHSAWLCSEAVRALKTLPDDPTKATLYPYKELIRKSKIKQL